MERGAQKKEQEAAEKRGLNLQALLSKLEHSPSCGVYRRSLPALSGFCMLVTADELILCRATHGYEPCCLIKVSPKSKRYAKQHQQVFE